MTERDIIEGCKRNDRACQEALYKVFSGKMKVTCQRYLSNSTDLKDVMQEGFLKVYSNIHKYNYQGSFEGWIRKIIVNTALTKVTKESNSEEVEFVEQEHESYDYSDAIGTIHIKELRRMIALLPRGYKMVFNMAAIDGFSRTEISQILKITEGTVRSQLSKARRMLQEKIIQAEKIIEHERG